MSERVIDWPTEKIGGNMSDEQLKQIYTGSGVGSGSYPASIDSATHNETEIVDSKQALTKLAVSLFFTIVAAIAQFLMAVAPDLAHIVLSSVPNIPFVSASLITSLFLSLAAWLQKRAADKHKVAVVKALVTEPSPELKAAYEAQNKPS